MLRTSSAAYTPVASILCEVENTSNGFCEKSNFSGFPEIWIFLWFFRKRDLDSVYTISILGEVENTSNGSCEKSNFSGFPEICKFFVIFHEGRFGLSIYDFYFAEIRNLQKSCGLPMPMCCRTPSQRKSLKNAVYEGSWVHAGTPSNAWVWS